MGRGSDRQRRRAQAARKAEKKRVARKNAPSPHRFKPQFGELPDPLVMEAIAESLHAAVTNVFDELEKAGVDTGPLTQNAKIKGRCLYYAAAGQYVASTILGRDYWVQVGSLGITTTSDTMVKIDAANGGVAARRFHMWLGADDGGLVEFVDFTSRFFKDWAFESGSKWEREDLPAYIWGRQKDLRELHGVYYQHEIAEEPEADRFITANQEIIARIVEQATTIARKRLLG